MSDVSTNGIEELLAQNERLREDLARAERKLAAVEVSVSTAGWVTSKLLFGRTLPAAIERWKTAVASNPGRLPVSETVDVFAAFVRRRFVAAAMIALLGTIPTLLLWQQNGLLEEQIKRTDSQNKLLEAQNVKLDQQTDLAEAGQVTALNGELAHVMGEIYQEARTACLRRPLPNPIVLRCWNQVADRAVRDRSEWLVAYEVQQKKDAGVDDIESIRRSLRSRYFLDVAERSRKGILPVSASLQGKLEALSAALRPYHVRAIGAPERSMPMRSISLERGLLLSALLAARVATPGSYTNAQLSFRTLTGAIVNTDLDGSDLKCTRLASAWIVGSMIDVDASGVDFRSALLNESGPWAGSKVDFADFAGAVMPRAEAFRVDSMVGTNLSGAIVTSERWLDELMSNTSDAPKGFVRTAWRIKHSAEGYWIVELSESGESSMELWRGRQISVAGQVRSCPGQILIQ